MCDQGKKVRLDMRIQRLMIRAIDWYQDAFSYRLSPCRFYPSCSAYAKESIETYGSWQGVLLSVRRLSRCRPFGSSGYDPVPEIHDCREQAHLTKVTT